MSPVHQLRYPILSFLDEGAIALDYLEGFSDELRERMGFLFREQE